MKLPFEPLESVTFVTGAPPLIAILAPEIALPAEFVTMPEITPVPVSEAVTVSVTPPVIVAETVACL